MLRGAITSATMAKALILANMRSALSGLLLLAFSSARFCSVWVEPRDESQGPQSERDSHSEDDEAGAQGAEAASFKTRSMEHKIYTPARRTSQHGALTMRENGETGDPVTVQRTGIDRNTSHLR